MAPTAVTNPTVPEGCVSATRRRKPFFQVTKADVRALEEACERKHLATTRSVFFAIAELANDHRHEDSFELARKDLGAKAGVGMTALDGAIKTLVKAKLVKVEGGQRGQSNRWTLVDQGYPLSGEGVPAERVGGTRSAVPTRAGDPGVRRKEVKEEGEGNGLSFESTATATGTCYAHDRLTPTYNGRCLECERESEREPERQLVAVAA